MAAPAAREMTLRASDLACIRGGRLVYQGLGFEVASGEALVLVGPNGAGKSSLLRQIAGLVELAEGHLTLNGGKEDISVGEQAHYLGHLDALKPAFSVEETLRFWGSFLDGAGGAQDVLPALDAVRLGDLADLSVAYLSAGQRKRLALARLLVAPRPLWLLDEPSVALDKASTAILAELMEAHLALGGLIVAATHLELGLKRQLTLDLSPRRQVA
jgi:heme exporter protein A